MPDEDARAYVLAQIDGVLRTLRERRPAESLHVRHLVTEKGRLRAVTGVSTDDEACQTFVAALKAAGSRAPGTGSLPAAVVRDMISELWLRPVSRSVARANLARRFGESHGITARNMRAAGGAEDAVLLVLADFVLEAVGSKEVSARTVIINELVFGLTMWLGTDEGDQRRELENALIERGFTIEPVKLSALIANVVATDYVVQSRDDDLVQYLTERMDAGDKARTLGLAVMAELSIQKIVTRRSAVAHGAVHAATVNVAYIIDSLMHPEEVKLLRSTYGSRFFLIAFHEDEDSRRNKLLNSSGAKRSQQRLAAEGSNETIDQCVDRLIKRNRGQGRRSLTQPSKPNQLAVERVFHRADVFVDVTDPGEARRLRDGRSVGLSTFTIRRFVDQVFANPFSTPTRHELGMAHAFVEARKSAAVTRQVGAAICTESGDLISVGANEAPAAGGGQYPAIRNDELVDYRDPSFLDYFGTDAAEVSVDPNDDIKMELLMELLEGLCSLDVVGPSEDSLFPDESLPARERARRLLKQQPKLRRARIFDIIEFTRLVHAEMAAILGAMHRGVSVAGCVLYCTTMPCHECARHIIMAGISRVVYVEPYPKSRISQIHPESTVMGKMNRSGGRRSRVEFTPFIGISPDRQVDLYSPLTRKVQDDDTGRSRLVEWSDTSPALRPTIDGGDDPLQQSLSDTARSTMESAVLDRLGKRSAHLQIE